MDGLARTGFRGLVVIEASDLYRVARLITSLERLGLCIAVASSGLRDVFRERCITAGFSGIGRLLGYEADNVVIATQGFLSPNALAALAGLVRAGGALFLLVPLIEDWDPGPLGGRGGYRSYLLSSVEELESLLWIRVVDRSCRVRAKRLPARRPRQQRAQGRLPRGFEALSSLLTSDQARGLRDYLAARRRLRSLLVQGDRGRGKSFFLGVVLATEAARGFSGDVALVAPSPYALQSLFRGIIEAARRLGLGHRVVDKGGLVLGVEVGELSARYARPEAVRAAPIIVVDEAAVVGVARLRRYAARAGRLLVATTIHGYEGSGRYLAHYAETILPQPSLRVVLDIPARYLPGDPLEEWINKVFVLKPELPEPPRIEGCADKVLVEKIEPGADKELLRRMVSLLHEAHYRIEPDYILVVLESQSHEFYAATCHGSLVAVADVAYEEPGYEDRARLSLKLLGQVLGREPETCAARVVRIAVHPRLQRRGIGSKLLARIEEEAAAKGCGLVTAIYGRHDVLRFWLRNRYQVYYMSPRFNRVTGEKNIAVAKPLGRKESQLLHSAVHRFMRHLLLSAHGIYRDVAAENIASIISSSTDIGQVVDIGISMEEASRALKKLKESPENLEQVFSTLYAAALARLPGAARELSERELVATVAYLLQGKPLNEVADILGSDLATTRKEITRAAEKLLMGLGR